MIVVYHKNNRVSSIWSDKDGIIIERNHNIISKQLFYIANKFPNELLVWCHETLKEELNIEFLKNIFREKNLMVSYCIKSPYLTDAIGYVNESPFIKIQKDVPYPTWLMSSDVGGIYTDVFLKVHKGIGLDKNFNFFLNSIAKMFMPLGLFCYSNPKLLKQPLNHQEEIASNIILFRFVKQHYKFRWVFLMFLNKMVNEHKVPFFALIGSLFYKRRIPRQGFFEGFKLNNKTKCQKDVCLDVIIPTIGRKWYLYKVLKNLSEQTILPKNVIIVEQNPINESVSELDYLKSESWPFTIKHRFIHQTGVCHSRNIALTLIESDWIFFADDDIVIGKDFIAKTIEIIGQTTYKAFTFHCHLKSETTRFNYIKQWEAFGSGCSVVNRDAIIDCTFSESYEYGFGEDADFGMQIRNKGVDIIYLPEPSILHLKAPIGGFRTKPEIQWKNENIQPKPSPTVMLFQMLHRTKEQYLGYKILLFLKYYKIQSIKNPFVYYKIFKKQWQQSVVYANKLKSAKI